MAWEGRSGPVRTLAYENAAKRVNMQLRKICVAEGCALRHSLMMLRSGPLHMQATLMMLRSGP